MCWPRLIWCCFLACSAGCQSPRPRAGLEPVQRSRPLLGTYVTITVYASERSRTQDAISAAFAEIERVDGLLSVHRSDSEAARVNAGASARAIKVSDDFFHVLSQALGIARQTRGAFDPTVRPLVDLWGFLWKDHRLPSQTEIDRVLPQVDYRLVELNAEARTVRFLKPEVTLDFGGIGKGFAVDCALAKLQALGITNVMVKAGGDLRVLGLPPGRDSWEIQLEDPTGQGRRTIIPLRAGALSTSGNYENFFVLSGRRYSHILDPRTGTPVEGLAACTLLAPTCLESDAWATACFVYGVGRSLEEFGQRYPMRLTLVPGPGAEPWPTKQTESFPGPLRKR